MRLKHKPVLGSNCRILSAAEEWSVPGEFFPDVPGPIPFGGLGSDDPFAFKVYQPNRLVGGRRMTNAPSTAPGIVPMPPANDTPPTTAAAMT